MLCMVMQSPCHVNASALPATDPLLSEDSDVLRSLFLALNPRQDRLADGRLQQRRAKWFIAKLENACLRHRFRRCGAAALPYCWSMPRALSSTDVTDATDASSASDAADARQSALNPPNHPTEQTVTCYGVTYRRHPLSALFGNLGDDDYALLRSSIEQVGQQRPILLAAGDGHVVLDGWNRLRVLAELNREPVTCAAEKNVDEVQLVTAVNLAQRTLTAGQRALIAARLANYTNGGSRAGAGRIHADAAHEGMTSSAAAALDGEANDGFSDFAASQKNQSLNLDSDSFPETAGKQASETGDSNAAPPPISLADAADRLGVSRAYAARARSVADKAAREVLAAVQSGTLSLNEAAELASKPVETQTEYMLRRIKEGAQARKEAGRATLDRDRQFDRHVRKRGVPPDDATPAEIATYITAILATAGTTAAQLGNWIEDGRADPKQSSFEQYFAAVDRLRGRVAHALPR